MGKLYEIVIQVAKGIKKIYLNSNRPLKELINNSQEIVGKGIRRHE
ncbi:MAG: hypothetical protein MJA82_12820 [Clostridia bacterium]|nr:hypothetical protein [Clostridia bacterium]